MAEASDAWGILYQNLMDAGCDLRMAQQCMALAKDKKALDILKLLSKHRSELLEELHEQQRKLDCLDFLLYKLGKAIK